MSAADSAPPAAYRPVAGFPGYRVGSDGSVWSAWVRSGVGTERIIGLEWRQLKLRKNGYGYMEVGLHRPPLRPKTVRVHHLVLAAFVGPRPSGAVGCHWPDNNPENNSVGNLRWDTQRGNMADKYAHGTVQRGEMHGAHKLTEISVREIRSLSRLRIFKQRQLAGFYGVCIQCIEAVCQRRAWKHVA